MSHKITLKDIAKELDVSISTVSKALRDSSEISKKTKDKIIAFANYYHYKPNSTALKLQSQKTMIIGIVIPEIVHHFFTKVISGIEKVLNKHNYNVMICLSNESLDKEIVNINMLTDGSVDGLIISIAKETLEKNNFTHFNEIKNNEIPLVLFDRISDKIESDKVIVDDIGGGYKATKHLIEIGCNNIALLTTPNHVTVGLEREKGHLKALKEAELPSNIIHIHENKDIKEQIEKLFNHTNAYPDGIFAVNEIYAATAIKIARSKGLKIPDDIAVVGFTDGLISKFTEPSLTTIAQHGFTMGEQAAELLLSRIKNQEKPFEKKVISTNLKIRKSTQKNKTHIY